ncbi:(2Fe-2S)-binding protein [Streptomyces albireticuli]|uniref:(2Fe-2S)-binding protein n=1 Tax=Streptomyces albireticuli TaxID=1940 RepID=A0A1Z2L6N3_9ACTN|nr:(2Fe-2S)-binding protein [Streptomyces albireticuli]ARZ69871.1 (2Fe-2S)-binding protein [Streptomyces albireticuli]
MSDEQQRHAQAAGPGGWQPIPRGGEFDEGTTFLQLPPELLAHPGAGLSGGGGWDPLAATGGGGYTPPVGEPWQQPQAPVQQHPEQPEAQRPGGDHPAPQSAPEPVQAPGQQWAGEWGAPAPAPYEHPHAAAEPAGADPHATAEWAMPFAAGDGADGRHATETGLSQGQGRIHGRLRDQLQDRLQDRLQSQAHDPAQAFGQQAQAHDYGQVPGHAHWSVPAAGDDPVDESGEYLLHGRTAPQPHVHGDPHARTDHHLPPDPHGTDGHGTHWAAPAPEAAPLPDGALGTPGAWEQQVAAAPVTASVGGPLGAVPGGDTGASGQWTIPVASGDTPEESGEYALDAFADAAPGPVPGPPAAMAAAFPSASVPPAEPAAGPVPGSSAHPTGVTGTGDHPTNVWTSSGPVPAAAPEPETEPVPPVAPQPVAEAPATGEPAPDGPEPVADGGTAPETQPEAPAAPAASAQERPETPADAHPEQPGDASAAPGVPTAPGAAAEPAHPGDGAGPDLGAGFETAPGAAPEPAPEADPAPQLPPHTEHPCASYVLRVNGTDRPVTDAWIGESLLYVLRERLGLAGAKDGCSQGECGACSVQVDGRLVASCLVPAATAAGAEVRTVEGLATGGRPSDVQRALADCGAVQCGFCVPGMAMTMHDLLEGNHAPTELETRQAICGNLCRCSGYRGVLDAVRQVVEERAETAAAPEEPQPDADQARIPHQAGPHGGGSGRAME